ncbi:hypothetical protein BGZ60DRAFT_378377 [Tricladium varicosporioides]|nr:hypothetical protein BGZ60DRAFT_378377 [Hymenoscyphus varicosporioides]
MVLSLAGPASATLKLSCSQLVIDRIDPLVEPGVIGSSHLHQIVGGNSFNATMNPTIEPSSLSTCTSCTFLDDFSNYWTASMYFQARNGSFKRIQQLGSLYAEKATGGITVYYFDPPRKSNVSAFKKGFRMRNGDPTARDKASASAFRGITYTCLEKEDTRFTNITDVFPSKFCKYGILTTIYFPPCWDGVNLDMPDHHSHVAYPTEGRYEDGAICPNSHPVQIPQLAYEIRWDTSPYNSAELWPEDGSQPFVWSSGDKTGYGSHGDYLFGWKGDSLQRAFNAKCTPLVNCANLPTQEIAVANTCTKKRMVEEAVDGWLEELPGGVEVDA